MSDVTKILAALASGDSGASDQLLAAVYDELRQMAAARMANEPGGHTLQPTALVHEAWLRLGGGDDWQWQNRAHFFSAAAEAMRRILIERARRKQGLKHGGGLERVDLDLQEIDLPSPLPDEQLLAVDAALTRLADFNAQAARIVTLIFFVGLTQEQVARELNVSLSRYCPRTNAAWRAVPPRRDRDPGAMPEYSHGWSAA